MAENGRLLALKRLLGPEWRFRTHRLGRVRWLTKYRLARSSQTDVGVWRRAVFVLLDPEVESFSYEIDNEEEVICSLAQALGRPVEELAAYAAETRHDHELALMLARHLRWRFHLKRRPPLGNRLAWYLAVRAEKPKLVLETGIYLGLGSLTLLRALQRNAEEGHPGELMSFDVLARSGGVVPEQMRQGWRRFIGTTDETVPAALAGREVDMMFQDTPHVEANQRVEFGAALAHAGRRLLLFDGSGGKAPTLQELSGEHGGQYHRLPLRSRDHVYPGDSVAFSIFSGLDGARRQPEPAMRHHRV